MLLDDPKIDELREKFNAWQRRQELAHANRTGSWNGASCAGEPMRFVVFCRRLEGYERAGIRFAGHTNRVERALFAERIFAEAVRLNRFYADLLQRTA